jgi:hypothetical protein
MSALPPKADMGASSRHVRLVPKPGIGCGLCYHFVGAGDCIDDTSSPSALAVVRLEKQTMQKMTRRVLGAAGFFSDVRAAY